MTRFLRCTLGLALVLGAPLGPCPGGRPADARTRFEERARAERHAAEREKWNGGGSRLRV